MFFFNFILQSIFNFIIFIDYNTQYPTLYLRNIFSHFYLCIFFLRKHTLLRFNSLTELTVLDNPAKAPHRFTLVGILTSTEFNWRIQFNMNIKNTTVPSLSSIYLNSNWSEREIRDMFGVYFLNNIDLRRLLTDYGFEGFPLRKDFPLTGYVEVRYNDEIQRIAYEPVELAQEFRVFSLNSPWENLNK